MTSSCPSRKHLLRVSRQSSCSTASSSGSSVSEGDLCQKGWMYWRREGNCYLKVLAVLRHEFLWLTRGDGQMSSMPLIQIAVHTVWFSDTNCGFHVADVNGEVLNLFPYDAQALCLWMNALSEAATITRAHVEAMKMNTKGATAQRSFSKAYVGTLRDYRKDQKERSTHRFKLLRQWSNHCKKGLEKALDRCCDVRRNTRHAHRCPNSLTEPFMRKTPL